MPQEKIFIIDGNNFSDYKGFAAEFSRNIFGDEKAWRNNLDAFNDMLYGGYGSPDENEPFTIRWLNSKKSQKDLGYAAMLKWLTEKRNGIRSANTDYWDKRIELSKVDEGETLFLILIDIIVAHKNIKLSLE